MKPLFLLLLFLPACASPDELPVASADVIADGFLFTEGPVWSPEGELLFSDIPANVVYRWRPDAGVDTFLTPSGHSNGLAFHPSGGLMLAQHDGTVSLRVPSGRLHALAQWVGGKRLNSPNDLAFHPSGYVFFTDPPFGVSDEDRMLDVSGVYKVSPDGDIQMVYDGFELPNGIAFSSDFSRMYVCDSKTGDIFVWQIDERGNTGSPQRFANIGGMTSKGGADGLKVDSKGRVFTTGPNGLTVLNSQGRVLQRMEFAEQVTNLAWGATESVLYMTATDKVYQLSIR